MAQPLFRTVFMLFGLILIHSSAFSQETEAVPFQTLHTPKGLKILFSSTKQYPLTISIGFKQPNYNTREGVMLADLVATLLNEKAHPLLKDPANPSLFFGGVPGFFADKLFIAQFETSPEQLGSTLAVIRQCLEPISMYSSALKAGVARKIEALKTEWKRKEAGTKLLKIKGLNIEWSRMRSMFSELKRIQVKELTRYSAQNFTRDNLMIGIVGDIEAEHLMRVIDQHFGTMPRKSSEINAHQFDGSREASTKSVDSNSYFISKNTPRSVLHVGVSGGEGQPYLDELATELLWSCLSRPIYTAVKEACDLKGLNPCHYINVPHIHYDSEHSIEIGFLEVPPEAVSMSRASILQVLKEVKIQGVSPTEFERLKRMSIEVSGEFLKGIVKNNREMANYLLYLQHRPKINLARRILALKSLNKADMDRVARHLSSDPFLWVEEGKIRHLP